MDPNLRFARCVMKHQICVYRVLIPYLATTCMVIGVISVEWLSFVVVSGEFPHD